MARLFKIEIVNFEAVIKLLSKKKRNVLDAEKKGALFMARRMKKRLAEAIRTLPPYSSNTHNTKKHISQNPHLFTQYHKVNKRAYSVGLKDQKINMGTPFNIKWLDQGHEIKYYRGYGERRILISSGRFSRPANIMEKGYRIFKAERDMDTVVNYVADLIEKIGTISGSEGDRD